MALAKLLSKATNSLKKRFSFSSKDFTLEAANEAIDTLKQHAKAIEAYHHNTRGEAEKMIDRLAKESPDLLSTTAQLSTIIGEMWLQIDLLLANRISKSGQKTKAVLQVQGDYEEPNVTTTISGPNETSEPAMSDPNEPEADTSLTEAVEGSDSDADAAIITVLDTSNPVLVAVQQAIAGNNVPVSNNAPVVSNRMAVPTTVMPFLPGIVVVPRPFGDNTGINMRVRRNNAPVVSHRAPVPTTAMSLPPGVVVVPRPFGDNTGINMRVRRINVHQSNHTHDRHRPPEAIDLIPAKSTHLYGRHPPVLSRSPLYYSLGLEYLPERIDDSKYRTVLISGLPRDIPMVAITSLFPSGHILVAQTYRGPLVTPWKTVRLVFFSGHYAESFVKWAEIGRRRITFGNHDSFVQLIRTPSYPIITLDAVQYYASHGATERLTVPNLANGMSLETCRAYLLKGHKSAHVDGIKHIERSRDGRLLVFFESVRAALYAKEKLHMESYGEHVAKFV